MTDLPKTIGSWADVVAWINHLNERIRDIDRPWHSRDIAELEARTDLLVFRFIEPDLVEVLLNEGDEEGPEHSMRLCDFEPHLHETARAWGFYFLRPAQLVEELTRSTPKAAIYAERRGSGYRVLTDVVQDGPSSNPEDSGMPESSPSKVVG